MRAMYSPMTPSSIMRRLPISSCRMMTVVKPSTACPLNFIQSDCAPSTRAKRKNTTPSRLATRRGTEENAVISTPFGLEPVVFGFGKRDTDTDAIAHSIIEKDIGGFAWDLVVIGEGRPHYILLSTDTSKYGKDEYLELDLEEDIFLVGGGMLRTPELFEYRYNNTEILILKVSSNLTGVLWNNS